MLTHVDQNNQPTMVDVSHKTATLRRAKAQSVVSLPKEIFKLFDGTEIHSQKGPVFQTAIIAGTMAAKQTSSLIPFCHPLPLESCQIEIMLKEKSKVVITCTVQVHHKTGVEMEALMGCNLAALTVYDMCKAMSHDIVIEKTRLLEKTGGKSEFISSL